MPTKPPIEPNIRINRKVVKIILITITIIAIAIFSGYPQYAFAYIRCGQAPVAATPNYTFGGYDGYSVPGSYSYKVMFGNIYYCTRDEAEANSMPPNPLSGEGLKRSNELYDQSQMQKQP